MVKAAERPATRGRPPEAPGRRVLLLAGLGIAAFLVFFPAKQLVVERMRITRLEQRLEALQAENAKLEREVRTLENPEELELLARERLGLVRPGERAYLLVPQPTPPPPAKASPKPAPSPWSRAWRWLVELVRPG